MFTQKILDLKARAFELDLSPSHAKVARHIVDELEVSEKGMILFSVTGKAKEIGLCRESVSRAMSALSAGRVIRWSFVQGSHQGVVSFMDEGAL